MLKVLPSTYFGNIQYFSKIIGKGDYVIDVYEHFTKQTFRNRCDIVGANGKLTLSVPTIKNHNKKTIMKDVLIDYDTDWQKQHLRSIISAYKNSPYFDYFFDIIEPIFHNKEKFLIDLNIKSTETALSILGLTHELKLSESFVEKNQPDIVDYRTILSPKYKGADVDYKDNSYYQVFSEKMEFIANCSILDLIFCEGIESKEIIRDSINSRA